MIKICKIFVLFISLILVLNLSAISKDKTCVDVESFFKYDKSLPIDVEEKVLDETGDYIKYHFWLRTTHERHIPGVLVIPKKSTPPYPIVFLQHGIHNIKEAMIEYGAEYLIKAGYAIVAIDAEYHGERKIDISGQEFTYLYIMRDIFTQSVIDIQRTIDYLEKRKDIDPNKIAYWGHSFGSLIGVIAVSIDKRIKTTVFVGTGDFETAYGSMFKYVPDYKYVGPVMGTLNYAGSVSNLLIIQGKKDNAFSKESTEKLFESIKEPKKIIWLEEGHLPPAEEVMPITIEWLNTYLKK